MITTAQSQKPAIDPHIPTELLAAEHAAIGAHIEKLREKQERLRAEILNRLDFGTHPAGSLRVQIQHNRRLDPAKVQATYPVVSYPELYRPALDTAAVKRHIAPAELDTFYVEGAPKVIIS